MLDSLLASHALIAEDGIAVARKAEGERRVALNLEYAEVERVLGEVGGPRWCTIILFCLFCDSLLFFFSSPVTLWYVWLL